MIRTILKPEKQDISLHLPKEFIEKKIEILAFLVEDEANEAAPIHYLSEATLAKDWLLEEEDKAWKDL